MMQKSTKYTGYDGSTNTASATNSYKKFDIASTGGGAYGPYLGNILSSAAGNGGVIFGTGTAEPSVNDYCLSGELVTTITGTASVTFTNDDNGATASALYTLTNTGSADVVIGEIGLIASLYSSSSTNLNYKALLERTVLDQPMTIPAGGIGQVTYTIRMNYPTA
jgi:hypothetical protein